MEDKETLFKRLFEILVILRNESSLDAYHFRTRNPQNEIMQRFRFWENVIMISKLDISANPVALILTPNEHQVLF